MSFDDVQAQIDQLEQKLRAEHLAALAAQDAVIAEQDNELTARAAQIALLQAEVDRLEALLPDAQGVDVVVNLPPSTVLRLRSDPWGERIRGLAGGALLRAIPAIRTRIDSVGQEAEVWAYPDEILAMPPNQRQAEDEWLFVQVDDVTGWCAAWLLEPVEDPPPPEPEPVPAKAGAVGWHCDTIPTTEQIAAMVAADLPVVLINAAPDWGAAIERIAQFLDGRPHAKVIIRDNTLPRESYWQYGAEGARLWFEELSPYIERLRQAGVNLAQCYFMGLNEYGDVTMSAQQRIDWMPTIVEYENARGDKLQTVGAHIAALNASTGTPGLARFGDDPVEMDRLRPLIEGLARRGDLLILHGYWYPQDSPLWAVDSPYHFLRFVTMWLDYIQHWAPGLQIVIGEAGYGVPGLARGWRTALSEAAYYAQIAQAKALLAAYSSVLAFLIFCLNCQDVQTWGSFTATPTLFDHVNALQEDSNHA